jgi:hypothetical protein
MGVKLWEASDGVKHRGPHQRAGFWTWMNFWVKIETGGQAPIRRLGGFHASRCANTSSDPCGCHDVIFGGVERFPNEFM